MELRSSNKRRRIEEREICEEEDEEDNTEIRMAYQSGTSKRVILPRYTEDNAFKCSIRVKGHVLTLHDLKTVQLKETLDRQEVKALRKTYSGRFQKSWMNDNAIYCFLKTIADSRTNIVGSIETEMIFNGEKTNRLFHNSKGNLHDNWVTCEQILFPYCVDDCHWALLYVHLQRRKVYCFDPSGGWKISSRQWRNLQLKLNTLIDDDDAEWILRKRDIYRQVDNYSCGPFICSYAESLVQGRSLKRRIDPVKYRNHILETLINAAEKKA